MNNKNNYHITPSLRQGEKYNSYQKKIGKTFNKSSSWVEGFTSQFNPFFQTSNQDKLSKTQLTQQTKNVLNETQTILNDSNSSLSELKQIYQDTLTKYNNLMKEVNGESTNYVTRVGSKNPYLNKVVRFTSGHICYVTNQGVVKYIPTMEVWQGLIDNGCGSYNYIELSIPFLDTYWTPGIPIATNPQLISGTTMTLGQGCGNEGSNVFVNKLVTNPTTSYLGCYNNLQPVTYIQFSPTTMTSTNSVNGYTTNASSIYNNYNETYGPWCAFDGNVNTWWHTLVESGYTYNSTTGVYEGDNSIPYTDSTGTLQTVKGEFLQLNLPSATVLTKYELQGRPGMPERDPNTWYILGDKANGEGWWLVDYQSNVSLNGQLTSFTIPNTTAYGYYIILVTQVGCPTCSSTNDRYCLQIATWNLYTSNASSSNNPAMTQASSDYITYDQCSQYAIENGYTTFGLQNAQSDGTGLCMVSNDATQPQMYGQAYGYPATNLWSSYTNNGVSAVLNNYGSLQVLNSSNAAVYSSPAINANPANYLGCYQDGGTRALPDSVGNYAFNYDLTSCSQAASSGGYQYFGVQAYGWTGGGGQCFLGNDVSQATSYGKASNCQTLSDGTPVGGGWSNAVYSVNPSTGSNYYLILQDDGNMCIYRGTGPTDNQGLIWATNTNGKQQDPNPLYSATKGKTGVNYMVSGDTLNVNEFIGSTDGSMYLMMMPGGDIELNTSTKSSSCSTYSGKNVGGQNSNAVYQIDQPGYKSIMGQVGFIDEDSVLYTYPSTNVKYTNDYTKINNMDSGGNDIPGAAFSNANVDQCKSTCNQNAECAGFVFDNQNNICWPKGSGMYPVGATEIQTGISLYTRNKSPIEPPIGSSDTIKNIDSVQYNSYTKSSSAPPTSTGLANATSYQKQQLSQMQDQLNLLSARITNYTNQFTNESININEQSTNNAAGLNDYLDNMEQTTLDIHNEKRNLSSIDNIEKQVNIQTLQQNYQYMFWTILAGAMILIIINMKKSITPK
jgi:hypothetical protein